MEVPLVRLPAPLTAWICAVLAPLCPIAITAARGEESPSLRLEAKIPLGQVSGRIDHMAVDLPRERLFVAELGNGTVGVIDLRAKRGLQRLKGFREPQGVGYVGTTDTLYVASGGDRSLRVFQGTSLEEGPAIKLGDDADNVRIQPDEKRVFVGYGRGALAIVDVESNRKLADIELPAHPESFRLESGGEHIFVNLPDDRSVVVVDRNSRATVARWPTPGAGGNFPMALDEGRQRVLVVFRQPAKLAALSMADGTETAAAETCGDSDDVFLDEKRNRIYVSCGEGFVDVFEVADAGFRRTDHIATVPGARTSLFVPELDRLFLAVRASRGRASGDLGLCARDSAVDERPRLMS
jgi:hypothetical protein